MAKVIEYTYDELRNKVTRLREAKDSLGNRLYTEEDIANYIGFSDVKDLQIAFAKAIEKRRDYLIKRVKELKEEGRSTDQIAGQLKISENTVLVLSDSEGHERMKACKEFIKERQKRIQESFKSLDDIGEQLGFNSIFK